MADTAPRWRFQFNEQVRSEYGIRPIPYPDEYLQGDPVAHFANLVTGLIRDNGEIRIVSARLNENAGSAEIWHSVVDPSDQHVASVVVASIVYEPDEGAPAEG